MLSLFFMELIFMVFLQDSQLVSSLPSSEPPLASQMKPVILSRLSYSERRGFTCLKNRMKQRQSVAHKARSIFDFWFFTEFANSSLENRVSDDCYKSWRPRMKMILADKLGSWRISGSASSSESTCYLLGIVHRGLWTKHRQGGGKYYYKYFPTQGVSFPWRLKLRIFFLIMSIAW